MRSALFLLAITWLGSDGTANPYESPPAARLLPAQSAKLDGLVRAGSLQVVAPCSDAVFLRRVFLDILGTLPTREEATAFLADNSREKRGQLIDRLLARPEFADYWGMRWGDVLRIKSEFPVNLWPNATQAYDAWIRAALRQNMPYSQFAHQLITASGSNFRVPPVNFLRAAGGRDPESLAAPVVRVFMGSRLEAWPPKLRADISGFFSSVRFKPTKEWKEEVLVVEPGQESGPPPVLLLPNGESVQPTEGTDPRAALADWLVKSPESPFAANGVNRVWFWIFGRGIVHEPDDFRPDNPPSNPALLDWLAKQYSASGYDTKKLLAIILNSAAYQASSIPGQDKAFAFPVRRIDAEVLVDAINQVTGGADEYSSLIPEPFTFLPEGTRAIELPDGSITSSVLELFGRPPRDTGLLTERTTRVTTAQRLQILNSRYVLEKLKKSRKLGALLSSEKDARSLTDSLYLTILSRYPTDHERDTIQAHQVTGKQEPKQWMLDVAWALINSPEFLYKH
jgi:hypothetical protein